MASIYPFRLRREGFQNIKIQGFTFGWPEIGRARDPENDLLNL
jgi:hypothetical protein